MKLTGIPFHLLMPHKVASYYHYKKPYKGQIKRLGTYYHLGYFDTYDEALEAENDVREILAMPISKSRVPIDDNDLFYLVAGNKLHIARQVLIPTATIGTLCRRQRADVTRPMGDEFLLPICKMCQAIMDSKEL